MSLEVGLSGHVVDEEGRPVEGAEVRLKPGRAAVTSGTDGAFTFENLERQCYWPREGPRPGTDQ